MSWARPVAWSRAVTWTIPLASISKVTSICGTPRGARVMPFNRKLPSSLLPRVICRSPWKTLISTEVWKLAAVV